jgi:hypothetical protein
MRMIYEVRLRYGLSCHDATGFIKIGSGIQKFIQWDTQTHRHQGNLVSQHFFFHISCSLARVYQHFEDVQTDFKLLFGVSRPINVNPDTNLESLFILLPILRRENRGNLSVPRCETT